jgi:NTP pyrophosphatase (non-canonical NTP hydrolase)
MTTKLHEQDQRALDLEEKAVVTWGPREQMLMAVEELAELQHAILKYLRGRATRGEVAEEMADVRITLLGVQQQLRLWDDVLAATMRSKLDRLERRLANPAEHYGPGGLPASVPSATGEGRGL